MRSSGPVPRPRHPETLTLSAFRKQPGEYLRDVHRNGKRYLLTKGGKPVALLVPVDVLVDLGGAGRER